MSYLREHIPKARGSSKGSSGGNSVRRRHPSTGPTGGTSRSTGAWIRSVSSTRWAVHGRTALREAARRKAARRKAAVRKAVDRTAATEEVPHGSPEEVRAASRRSGQRHLREGVQVRGAARGDRGSAPARMRQQRDHLEPRPHRRTQRLHRGTEHARLRAPQPLLRTARRRAGRHGPRLRQAAALHLHGTDQGPPGEGGRPRHRPVPGAQPYAGLLHQPPGRPGRRRPAAVPAATATRSPPAASSPRPHPHPADAPATGSRSTAPATRSPARRS